MAGIYIFFLSRCIAGNDAVEKLKKEDRVLKVMLKYMAWLYLYFLL